MARIQSTVSIRRTATSMVLLLGAGLFSAGAYGQSVGNDIIVPDTLQLPKNFVNRLIKQPDDDQRLLTALQQFERIDLDGNGVSQEDLDRKNLMEAARLRSSVVQRYVAYDLNADGIVTREEMENAITWRNGRSHSRSGSSTSARLRMKQRIKKQLKPFDRADVNHDGDLSASEVLDLAKREVDEQQERRNRSRRFTLESSIMSLDFNSDGTVSEQEFIAAISKLTPESTMGPEAMAAVRVVEPGCAVPQVKTDEKLVLLGTYDGAQFSNVTILGQDKVTWAAEAFVKKGTEPLYVVLTSTRPIIWKFTGATERIRKVVLNSNFESKQGFIGSGLTGVDKSKVSFVSGRKCLQFFYKPGSLKEAQAKAKVRDATGREPDYVLTQRSVGLVSLPDGPIEKVTRASQPRVRVKVGSRTVPVTPPGLIRIEASKVVSQKPAADYEVLPREAGLAQLLGENKIEQIDRKTYKIKQKIRIPAGLAGGHRAKFLLPKGVAEPEGDPGHSCVFSETTGRSLGRPGLCR